MGGGRNRRSGLTWGERALLHRPEYLREFLDFKLPDVEGGEEPLGPLVPAHPHVTHPRHTTTSHTHVTHPRHTPTSHHHVTHGHHHHRSNRSPRISRHASGSNSQGIDLVLRQLQQQLAEDLGEEAKATARNVFCGPNDAVLTHELQVDLSRSSKQSGHGERGAKGIPPSVTLGQPTPVTNKSRA